MIPFATFTSEELLSEPETILIRAAAVLREVHTRAWSSPAPKGLRVPPDLRSRYALAASDGIPREWGVERNESGARRPRPSAQGVELRAMPSDEAWSLAQATHFVAAVEALVLHIQRRLAPWFAEKPSRFTWIVSQCGEPRILDMGSWFANAGWSAEAALEEEGIELEAERVSDLPHLWADTLRYWLLWELAAFHGLTVPPNYWPPQAIRDKPFSSLPNPFLPAMDLWRCGVMLRASFGEQARAIVYVDARALPPAAPG